MIFIHYKKEDNCLNFLLYVLCVMVKFQNFYHVPLIVKVKLSNLLEQNKNSKKETNPTPFS